MKKLLLLLFLAITVVSANAIEAGKWYAVKCGSKALIIPNASMSNGVSLVLWTPTNVPSQLWQLEDNGDGTYSFVEGYMGEYLCSATSAKAGVKIVARTSGAKARCGTWQLKAIEGKTDTYNIVAKDGASMMSVTETTDGTQPTLVDATSPTGNCEWTLTEYAGEVQTCFNEAVRDDILNDFMAQYYHSASSGHVLGGGGFWGDAEMIETILDGFETTGDSEYRTYYTQLVTNFTARCGSDWCSTGQGWPRSNEYNDDITWMVLALVRGAKYFNNSNHLTIAKKNFDNMWARAIEPSGTLRWKEASDTYYGSNSCINGPAINAACYLYEMTGEEDYLEKAKGLWDKQYEYLCDHNDGHVWDSGSWDNSWTTFTAGNKWGSTYNQGTMLGACVNLYRLTGDDKYKNYADKVWNWSYKNLCASNNAQPNIMSACQTATGDLCGFKGILMRYCRLYAEEMNHEDVLEWMEKNAWFAYQNANSKGIIWSKWLTKTPEDFKDGDKDFSNDPFGCSTAVSVAFNAHVNRVFTKDAYSVIGAEIFDDIKGMQLSNSFDDDGLTPNTNRSKGGYLCFKNVDFGNADGATQCTLRLYSASDGGNYSLYIDKISDATKIGSVDALLQGWNDYTIDVTKTTGLHKVYAVPCSDINTRFHYIQFANPTSGIEEINENDNENGNFGIYNINGQRLNRMQKGLNIVGGKKVLVK